MTEPTTPNVGLIVPNTGDLVAAWGTAALNANWSQVDGLFGGVANISLSAATAITLTTPASTTSFTPGAGPNQSSNAAIYFSGTLSGNAGINFIVPGRYVIWNNCNVGGPNGFVIQLRGPGGGGNSISCPPGQKITVFFDGTNMDFVDMPMVGTYLDLAVASTPAWMQNCTIQPWLVCNGATYSTSSYTALASILGSTWGGNGITTFAVPDLQNRYRVPLDLGSNNRITVAGAGVNGAALGSIGGSQFLQQFTPSGTIGGSVVFNNVAIGGNPSSQPLAGGNLNVQGTSTLTVNGSSFTFTGNQIGSGSSQNIPPAAVAGLTFIKT